MDVVTSDDPLVFPIGNLDLPKSGPFESVFLEPISVVVPDDLENRAYI